MTRYPFLDLADVNRPYMAELQAAAAEVIASGRYIGGEHVAALESDMARLSGVGHAVAVGNGLDALRLSLRAYMELGRLKGGDEVIVPANSFIASALAVSESGLKIRFADVDASTMNIDWDRLPLSDATRAVMPVHLYGRVAPVPEDVVRQCIVLEDCAQAIGARIGGRPVGSLGHAGAFSFYPTKNVGALGDAGIVVTDDAELADCVRALANYGSRRTYHNVYRGVNSRLDPIQAALLRVKLPHLEAENTLRRANAAAYGETLDNPLIVAPHMPDSADEHVWHQYVVRILDGQRDQFRDYMARNGVETAIHYPTPIHRQPCYGEFADVSLPVAERLASEVVSLPIGRCTTPDDARAIAAIANKF